MTQHHQKPVRYSRATLGARVRLSELGRTKNPKIAERLGTVMGVSASGTGLRVRFDGSTTIMTIHGSYLVVLSETHGLHSDS